MAVLQGGCCHPSNELANEDAGDKRGEQTFWQCIQAFEGETYLRTVFVDPSCHEKCNEQESVMAHAAVILYVKKY